MSDNEDRSRQSVKKAMRWVWILSLSATACLVAALLFLLAQTTGNQDLYINYFGWLVGINITIAAILLLVLVWASVRLLVRLKKGRFGSRLLVKLAAIFVIVGFLPGLFVYAVSYQFVSRSIETWFDVKVEGALDAGLKLGRASYDAQLKDLVNKTQVVAYQLAQMSESAAILQMDLFRQQLEVDDMALLNLNGEILGASGTSSYRLQPAKPLTSVMRAELMQQRVMSGIEDNEDGASPKMWALAIVPISIYDVTGQVRVLRVSNSMPAALAANARSVQEAYQEYQERALGREGLRRMYIGTLTLALILAVFVAVVLAVVLGQQLLRPLLILAEGVRQVGAGDLSPKQLVHTHDELGGLTHAFADMTDQLREAQIIAEKSLKQVADARAHLQTILDNLTAGVIVLDRTGAVQSINPGAERILRQNLQPNVGQTLQAVPALEALGKRVAEQFSTLPANQDAYWQETFELEDTQSGDNITVVARGAWLGGTLQLLVIDDISDIISAQRSVAWGEVARRLAHEIKNPLTPIQLSAERIEHKFASKLEDQDRAVLQRSVKMIVDQVDAMKRLVNEFREYARLPVAELKPLDLNVLVRDIIQLYIGAQHKQQTHIDVMLAAALPMIKGDAAQLRQVLHNLLQNALDATEESQTGQKIVVATQYKAAQEDAQSAGQVCLIVRDSGCGFSEKILKRAFEPYVTTKLKGTGLGLAVVKKIMDEHGARIGLSNHVDEQGNITGAQVLLSFPALVITPTQHMQASHTIE